MNYILAIDTSFSQSCIALSKGTEIVEEVFLAGSPRVNDSLISQLEQLVTRHHLTLKDIEGIAIVIGPGSYTGLRLSIAAVKGIALVTQCVIKPLSVFDLFIQHYHLQKMPVHGDIISVIDTLRGDFYCQRYSQDFTPKDDPFFAKQDHLENLHKNDPTLIFIGQIQPIGKSDLLINFPSARDMVSLYFTPKVEKISIEALGPLYMRQTEFVKLKESDQ